jgi:flagellar operon protein
MIPADVKITPIKPGAARQTTAPVHVPPPAVNFRDILFSKHAALRLDLRDIQLSDDQIKRLGTAIGRAQDKGIRDSLVLMDDVALVVNVRSRTVITAMNRQENVFSNIDGAVII